MTGWEGNALKLLPLLNQGSVAPPCAQVISISCNQPRGIWENQPQTKKDSKVKQWDCYRVTNIVEISVFYWRYDLLKNVDIDVDELSDKPTLAGNYVET